MASKNSEGGVLDTLKTVIYAFLLAGLIRTLFFQPFYIPSGSMKPTLLIGDFLFVNKFAYGYSRYSCPMALCAVDGRLFFSEPERGDIVVFRHEGLGQDYIKRLIGLPGDTVQMQGGRLILNGEMLPLVPAEPFEEIFEYQQATRPRCANGSVSLGATCQKEQFIESLPNGVDHMVLNIGDETGDNTPIYTVPDEHYFFMGDNRDNSTDSRYFTRAQTSEFRAELSGPPPFSGSGVGFVHRDLLIGKANLVVFSAAGSSLFKVWNWRMDRLLEWVE
ncbi:signal peptidase I [Monaibacterium marinum]|uniref:Signal peptidase I n=1 Tax=Pontivivens marinum TaxID=1690039 RepID=A0A2C9CMP0_9RHOB|nr:signal peptidase I [Monaibacterium marinum]SOH92492.1 signal peptidase I [Monaibacterium marinum]